MMKKMALTIAVLLICMLAKIEQMNGAEPVKAQFFIDYKVQEEKFVGTVGQNLPNGSTMSGQKLHRVSFSSASMDNETFTYFSPNQYKEMAEIVIIFVNSDTKIDSVPKFSWKKKVFVVVFGSTVPETWNKTATDKNHVFLMTKGSNSSVIFEHLIRQINFDSSYYCDIDMYCQKKWQKCKACSYLCGTDPEQPSDACTLRCPYFWSKFKEEELDVDSDSTPTPVASYAVVDEKHTVILITVILGVLVIGGLITLGVLIKKKKLLTPCNSEANLREATGMVVIPLTDAHQETQYHGNSSGEEDGQRQNSQRQHIDDHRMISSDDCIVSLMEADSSSERDDGAGPSMPNLENMPIPVLFKNKREADLNAHYGNENTHNVH